MGCRRIGDHAADRTGSLVLADTYKEVKGAFVELKTIDGESLMSIKALRKENDVLVIEGRIMGALPIQAVLTPDEARAALKLLNARVVLFLLTMLFRKGRATNRA